MSFNVLKQKSGYFSLILTIVSGLGWSNAVIALELDIASEVVEVSQAGPVERHKIFLSRLKKISNSLSRDEYQMVQGVLQGQTYKADDDATLEEVMASLDRAVDEGYERLFECVGRGCGSSNEWANAVFGQPKLYGPESTQFYWVGKAVQSQTYWLVYGSKRSNKAVHYRVESVVSAAPSLKSRLFAAFSELGYLRLAWSDVVGSEVELAEALDLWCGQQRIGGVAQDKARQIALAVTGGDVNLTPSAGVDATERLASELLTTLAAKPGLGCQMSAFGLGRLSPIEGLPNERLDLILLP
ncbi:MAG TPA: hypothetical protein DCG72_02150 [Gammaproteobacteria bacterium]|jgi:hypothetical protein|nr:DUF4892 domain-containing protein [Pseudomonadales bacterium]HAF37762.1 hypothetical protein [Gammaproteobacteria bacterium]MDA8912261.1 DUF4892 domain-containing protein [Pseudomonadales bacterium]MDB3978227.1 DUF4892 domain-containing protein [Pseudomonadales bacterium]MDB4036404.1 DUF4892 domain-containing protein [Pseudomonadales bacterium]